MVKTKKVFKIAIVTLSIVTVSIIILAVWISRDDYVPQKLGNSVSAALNNRYGSSCSIVENDKYIFYVNCVKDSFPLVRIDKNSGEKKLLKKNIGDSDGSALFIYKNTLIYTKSKDLGYSNRYYDIYSCDFDGKNEKLIKKESPVPHMVIDDYIYVPNRDNALTRISLINGQKRTLNNKECNNFVGIDEKSKALCFDTDYLMLVEVKINNRRANLGLRNSTELMHIGSWKGEAKHGFGILGVSNGDIWFSGENTAKENTLCKAEKVKGKWQTKVMIGKIAELISDHSSAMEKDKIYYLSDDETQICMYDIKTGETQNIYEKADRKIKILAAIGDNILISEWNEDDKHVNYSSAVDDKAVRQYYINNSGKVLYELD
ncbi:DUF5050 domain-containing protein [uncultured Solobacterium sp.]|uniref:DUF5050 domain-containing protein n=1 Tax=uncultured Solobacterium sp. TaxID=747375 RepID=UPI00260EB8D5|nr:DUF5050 domain-containing protein [uncultured Solobacterium sp.]